MDQQYPKAEELTDDHRKAMLATASTMGRLGADLHRVTVALALSDHDAPAALACLGAGLEAYQRPERHATSDPTRLLFRAASVEVSRCKASLAHEAERITALPADAPDREAIERRAHAVNDAVEVVLHVEHLIAMGLVVLEEVHRGPWLRMLARDESLVKGPRECAAALDRLSVGAVCTRANVEHILTVLAPDATPSVH